MASAIEKHGDYNFDEYNAVEYNNDTMYITMDAEFLTPADVKTFVDAVLHIESLSMVDVLTRVWTAILSFTDFILFVDSLTKSITDKRLSDTVRLQDWLNIKKKPAANIWND